MTQPVTTARFFPWEGGAVFVGTAGELPAHAHQAIQICFLFKGRVRLRERDTDAWADYDVAIVPSRHSHGMDGGGVHYGATLFVEPETREGRILTERYLPEGGAIATVDRAPLAAVIPALEAAVREGRGRAPIVERARHVLRLLTQHTEPAAASDERILRAVKYVNGQLSGRITLEQVAAVAHLSPERFRHLFAEQIGMGVRQYVLWRRFVSAWEHRMNGASLSTAAHAAGFADSAHLTRTSRSMIGIPPSSMEVVATGEE
jgi:AraC-like DNA-binding protein